MTAAGGIATTSCLPTRWERGCSTSSPARCWTCTGGRARGTKQNGEPSVAIGHALAGEDFWRAADLVERAIPAMRMSRQEAALRGWLKALPDEVVRVRPVLSVGLAGAFAGCRRVRGC